MFRKLMTLDEARNTINMHFKPKPLGEEDVALLEAYNRVLKENVVSKQDIPPFNRSTVDGYAVKAQNTFGADENQPVNLKPSFSGVAGSSANTPLNTIATGISVPPSVS